MDTVPIRKHWTFHSLSKASIWVSQTLLLLDIEEREPPGERDPSGDGYPGRTENIKTRSKEMTEHTTKD